MGLTASMNIARQALNVAQQGINIVSNNVANMNTEGYSKLRMNLKEAINYTPLTTDPATTINSLSGVQISSITRYSDNFMQAYYWNQNSEKTYLDKYADIASNIESVMNELNGTGVANALDAFYSAASVLNSSPADLTARQNFISKANSLVQTFNNTDANLASYQTQAIGTLASNSESEMVNQIDKVNSLLDQIAKVNQNIIATRSSDNLSNSLQDQRDELMKELSNFLDVQVTTNSNGSINVRVANTCLVRGQTVQGYLAATNYLDANNNLATRISINNPEGVEIADDVTSKIQTGSIAAILDVTQRSTTLNINTIREQMDALAAEFADVFNEIQAGDPKGDGTTPLCLDPTGQKLTISTEDMFKTSDGSTTFTAGNIKLNEALVSDPYKIAAGRLDLSKYPTPADYEDAIGNSENANMMVNTRSAKHANLNGQTFENYLASTVGNIGTAIEDINTRDAAQTNVLTSVEEKMSSEKNVNLDEELSDMLKYQQAYKAASRVFSVCNELMDTLVTLGK